MDKREERRGEDSRKRDKGKERGWTHHVWGVMVLYVAQAIDEFCTRATNGFQDLTYCSFCGWLYLLQICILKRGSGVAGFP